MPQEPDLSIIIVNWNGGQVLLDCLASIYAHTPPLPFEVIVVDNASTDGSPERVAAGFPQVRLIQAGRNLGFAGGNNLGLQAAQGRFLLLLNNDTLVREKALGRMVAAMQADPSIGILGCRLLNPDGTLQRSCGLFPTLWTKFLDLTMLYRLVPVYRLGHWDYAGERDVDWLSGACLLLRREVYEQIGGLDEGYFMYLEDADLCRRAWQAGWRVHFTPTAEVVHLKGHSSRPALPRLLVEDQRSAYRFFRKHYGPGRVQALRLVATLGCLVRIAFWGGRALLGQQEATGRLRAYREILRRSWCDRTFVWEKSRRNERPA